MKILLIGEFSGVHNNLKKGFIELGHEVKIAADGDGFKNFDYDIKLKPYSYKKNTTVCNKITNILAAIGNLLFVIINFKKFIGYDVVQFISPFSISSSVYFSGLIHVIFRLNKKIYYYACGTDPNYVNTVKKLKYSPYPNGKNFRSFRKLYFNWFVDNVDGIIPAAYTYYLAHKTSSLIRDIILLPCSGEYKKNVDVNTQNNVKILFGITRREFKGSEYILNALNKIQNKYPDNVDIKIVEKLPFAEYINLLENADVLIDQCKSYSYGMNAIFAMQRGVITFSGSEEEANKHMDLKNVPVINIVPDSNQIASEIEKVINLSVEKRTKIKTDTINFIKEHHDLLLVTKKFLNTYCNTHKTLQN